ncbi:MAG: glycoside hydrolase, partial [Prevotella sp.]|nr:glycoside hydrolase [Prevotella sp.]
QWQWHANPQSWWYFANQEKGCLSLYSVLVADDYKNLWSVPNLLLQKIPAPEFTATMKLTISPDIRFYGERTGLVIMGIDYGLLSFENSEKGFILSQNECIDAEKEAKETVNESVILKEPTVYLRVNMSPDTSCVFSYSTDDKNYKKLGKSFKAREGKWIGAKIGIFCIRPVQKNDGGRVDIDWFRVTE